jgi:acyl-CoA synthetase (NDP forming)
LRRVLAPRSIAIVGISPNPNSFASRALRNLSGFKGPLYLVNPKYPAVGEHMCYPSLAALPEVPDCVIIAVGRDSVEPLVLECAAVEAGGAIIFAAGYVETAQPQYVALQGRLSDIAREAKLRIVGPNVIGIINHSLHAVCSFTTGAMVSPVSSHAIGLISQSSGIGNGLTQAMHHGVSFSHTLSAGNSCDVDCADYVAYLADDPQCRAIALVFESMPAPDRLLEAGEIARAADKPLLVHKLGRGEIAAVAARSHTGMLAGSASAYEAAFRRVGAIEVKSYEALIETAAFFAKAPKPSSDGLAIVSMSGGSAVHLADAAEALQISLPSPSPQTQDALRVHIPEFGIAANPCDVTAASNPFSRAIDCCEVMLADPAYASVITPLFYAGESFVDGFRVLGDAALKHGKPAVVAWVSEWLEGPGAREIHSNPGLSLFRSAEHSMAAISAWQAQHRRRSRGGQSAARLSPTTAAGLSAAILESSPDPSLTERDSKSVLACYGVEVVSEVLASSEEEAILASDRTGYPVVLKVESPDLLHKTEAGVVALNLKNREEVRAAYQTILSRAQSIAPAVRINGVLVQPMIPQGVEIMVGARIDPHFGPLITVGFGGIFVELMNDVTTDLAPVSQSAALDMLGRLKARNLLTGFRGAAPVDTERLAGVIARLSELAADHADLITEIDVNPLICAGSKIIAVDGLIFRRPSV